MAIDRDQRKIFIARAPPAAAADPLGLTPYEAQSATAAEQGPVERLLYGGRPGEGLPGAKGVPIDGRPSISDLENLSEKHGVEFAVTYKLGPGAGGGGGQYYLYSGTINSVQVPIEADQILIYHTHPMGTAWASTADKNVLSLLKAAGSPQRVSHVIPVGTGRAVPFGGS